MIPVYQILLLKVLIDTDYEPNTALLNFNRYYRIKSFQLCHITTITMINSRVSIYTYAWLAYLTSFDTNYDTNTESRTGAALLTNIITQLL